VIGPGAAARRIARRLTGALWIAAAAAAFAGVAGIYLSYRAELAAGASIAICAVAVFAVAMAVPRATGRPAAS
jgi:ABC-type Mn2+/Zn2+ transport system permease subunit